jgi:hypothetical protein
VASTMTKVVNVLDPRTGERVTRCPSRIRRTVTTRSGAPRRASGTGFGFGPELLDEMTTMKVVH